jgi:hypothetical protein
MQTRILAALLCGCAFAGTAVAETIVVNDQVQVRESQIERPKRGSTMDAVEKHFGAPVSRHPTAQGDGPTHASNQVLRALQAARAQAPSLERACIPAALHRRPSTLHTDVVVSRLRE